MDGVDLCPLALALNPVGDSTMATNVSAQYIQHFCSDKKKLAVHMILLLHLPDALPLVQSHPGGSFPDTCERSNPASL